MFKSILTLAALTFLAGTTSFALVSNETKKLGDRLGATALTEVSFDKKQTTLSDSEKSELAKLINDAKAKGEIREVKILVWSDREYPAKNRKLTNTDITLAKNRIDQVQQYLKTQLAVTDVDSYNMAETPNAVERMLKTSDAHVKGAAESTGATPHNDKETGFLGWKGKASKAVAYVFLK